MKKIALILVSFITVMGIRGSAPAALVERFESEGSDQGGLKASVDRGKIVYDTYCLPCHQANAKGVPGMNPPLIKTKWVLGDKKKLITILLKGMDQEIEVNGDVYNNIMPAQPTLTDQEMADVLTFVRNSFGNKASAVTVAEVKKQRAL